MTGEHQRSRSRGRAHARGAGAMLRGALRPSDPNQDYTLIQCVVFCFGVEGAIEAPGAAKAGQPLCDSHEIKKMLKNETSLSYIEKNRDPWECDDQLLQPAFSQQ